MQALSILQMPHSFQNSNNFAPMPQLLHPSSTSENQIKFENEENVEEEQEFSFVPFDDQKTLTFADEMFENGKIRTTSTTFDQYLVSPVIAHSNTFSLQSPLKKLFVVQQLNKFSFQSKDILKGSCKETFQKDTVVEVEDSNKKHKKSKSTSFSKIWRFRENIKLRRNSDGEDAFVLFNPSGSVSLTSNEAKKGKSGKCKITQSPHEKHYVMNKRKTETSRRRSFLPYRKNLIGFFTNVNGFSRNVNPF
ncbi:unnamed protein product [Sphenostylis stenocarpa]|uniref:Uncharacterized protein n=1 Tax=Sphenostylis stenocarpa TaxID=92480 RepID=A0AA86VIQ0_9FABA|nr:unnamed protein product [Sphenostylis stenocarpa]